MTCHMTSYELTSFDLNCLEKMTLNEIKYHLTSYDVTFKMKFSSDNRVKI